MLTAVQGASKTGKTKSIQGLTQLPEDKQHLVLFMGSTGKLPFSNKFTSRPIEGAYDNLPGTNVLECLEDTLDELHQNKNQHKIIVIDSLTDILSKEEGHTLATHTGKDSRQGYKVYWDKLNTIMDLLVDIGKLSSLYCTCTSSSRDYDGSIRHKAVVNGKHGDLGIERFFDHVVRTMQVPERRVDDYIEQALDFYPDLKKEDVFPIKKHSPYAEFYYAFKVQSTNAEDIISVNDAYPAHQLYVNNDLLALHKNLTQLNK